MSAPCINDTCSITSLIDPVTRRLELNARIDPTGGLQCIDGRGLGVHILGDPAAAAAIDTCFQQLGVSPAGELWSIPQRAKTASFVGDVTNIRQGGNEGDWSSTFSIDENLVNPYDCPALVLFLGRFEVGYTISTAAAGSQGNPTIDGGAMIPFNGDIQCQMLVDGTPQASVYFDIGGVVPSALNNSNKIRSDYFSWVSSIGASQSLDVQTRSRHEGNNESVNISTVNADVGFQQRGFDSTIQAIIFPFRRDAI